MKIPQTPSRTNCGNQDGQCSHHNVNWALFADRSQPKVDLLYAFPQERSAVPHSRLNNVIKIDGTASVPDTLIREMLVTVGKKDRSYLWKPAKLLHLSASPFYFYIFPFFAYFKVHDGLLHPTCNVYLSQICIHLIRAELRHREALVNSTFYLFISCQTDCKTYNAVSCH